jgi:PAS domain S-box-containing protein
MNLLSYLSFFNAIGCVILIFISLGKNRQSHLNSAFMLALLISLPWPIADIFIPINTAPPVLWPFHYLKTITWALMPPAILNFVVEFTKHFKTRKLIQKTIIFAPALIMYACQWLIGPFIEGFTVSKFGTADIPSISSPSFIVLVFYILVYHSTSLILLIYYSRKSDSKRFKREARLASLCIITGYMMTAINNILHQFLYARFPHSGPLCLFFLFLVLLYLVQQHQTVILDYSLFLSDIMNSIREILLIVLPDETIKHANQKLLTMLNYKEEEVLGKNLSTITSLDISNDNMAKRKQLQKLSQSFIRKDGQEVLADMQIYKVKDKYNEFAGAIIVAHLLSDFEQAVHHYNISTQEREVILLIIKGYINKEIADIMGIKAGTVKNYIYNIFKKTGVQNRIELVQLFNPV